MIKIPTKAVLDGDILAYRIAFRADTDGVDGIQDWVQDDLTKWTPAGVTDVTVAFSCSRKDNYRRKVLESYKAHRDVSRQAPESLPIVTQCIKDVLPHCTGICIEADDIMGVKASQADRDTIAVTIDKDLRSVPGWHWNPDKEESPFMLTEQEADRNFHMQWLTGDTTDNIGGIWKMGAVKANKLLDSTTPTNWTAAVMAAYETIVNKDKEHYDISYALQMARCVRILRAGEVKFVMKAGLIVNNKVILWTPHCWG